MVVINGVKYACETCIRGHRAAQCTHTDGPLQMIRRKGRPSTACGHCKELRRTKNFNPSGGCMCASARRPAVGSEEDETRCRCDEGEPCKCHTKRKSSRKSKGGSCHRRANDEAAHVNGLGIADLDVLLGLNGRSSDVDMTTTLPSLKPPLQNGEIKADSIDNLDLASLDPLEQSPSISMEPVSINETGSAYTTTNTALNDIDIPFSINELNELYKQVSSHNSHSQ
ncbi:AQG_2a_G0018850.mRNA.1.CDS.1 [Saccharomyces cerevisiae]|nr:Cup2p [Saccharomyces cerevisiae YJM993]AJR81904.1 Cup2p [Saccharomyces cerevisiae YJM453]AJR87833.1 Cup2p [Saccharomyces cerevisiae YJM969]AJR88330.1 Cup2p [Saccharomyces cerevisiae YJM972]AJR88831.1 Cup2p [Saccharomyces cerevisiae YJM975]AJR89303.1 Cup2p [Saccharomyces cerevisiae YJM978]AJR89802.1 Cup2p [Saccharomyces cerevisiae YJM981]AJR90304.1 Cup2p [Saccharomyces cerevisiae YJM984]AJR90790.1 Cup2p [Saccharomyces cerevisiae YJM987]AJR91286.1 Cup2p [Saccharomyces cerevisiae YJM990]A